MTYQILAAILLA